jgi:solute carrier family 13 (sodium-dependent dicarboxylate transporter), member 2/3/5
MNFRRIALVSGPLLFLLIAFMPAPAGMSYAAQITAGITLWIAIWWVTEPVNTAVTSLLPLALFPLSGVMPLKAISGEYGNEIIFLFMAGFFIGKTIEKWNLHRRIALGMVTWMGTSPAMMVLGFMTAAAFLSMWISNTATAVMMTPVAIAVGANIGSKDVHGANFKKALLLGVGYACSIGGLATIIGTPTNAIFLAFAQQNFNYTVTFGQWFMLGFPIAATLLMLCWLMLVRMFPLPKKLGEGSDSRQAILAELQALGPVSVPEKRLMFVFGAVVLSWITGSLLWYKWIPNCNDTVVAICGALILFTMPPGKKIDMKQPAAQSEALPNEEQSTNDEHRLLDWKTAINIPWGIILLFGGGLALAKGFDSSGLALWIGEQLKSLSSLPHVLILIAVLVVVVLLSEIASNIATASMMMPVLAALALSIGAHPFGLCLSATLAASVGFGLPVATAPNAIVYASGYLSTRDMARAGFLLDIISIAVMLIFIYLLLPVVWGLNV